MAKSVTIHIEVSQKLDSTAPTPKLREETLDLLQARAVYANGPIDFSGNPYLREHAETIRICDCPPTTCGGESVANGSGTEGWSFWQVRDFQVHVFQLCADGPAQESAGGDEVGDDSAAASCTEWELPALEFSTLWDTLIYDVGVKEQLLEYASTAMLFSDRGVDPSLISWNRVVLLHGPPGTGKTSLCQAIAQKLAIRLSDRYSSSFLLEINAHSLFSKWFSESGKLVTRLFTHIQEMVDDEECLVCVLIDEVESLTAARKAAAAGSEPSDAIRVVNALLTQIDQLRQRENVLVLTTSNITEAVDVAFVDRADIKQYIGLPSAPARFQILSSCVRELVRVGIVDLGAGTEVARFDAAAAERLAKKRSAASMEDDQDEPGSESAGLLSLAAARAEGLSGRALRKLPFQAHAFFVHNTPCTLEAFGEAMLLAVEREHRARAELVGMG